MPTCKTRSTATSSERDREHRRAQHLNQAGRVMRPDKQRQPPPCQAGRAHLVDGDDEVQARQDRREAGDEDADGGRNDT